MIKLKHIVQEIRKFDMDNVEHAAEFILRKTWAQMPAGEDKFSDYDVFLWLDNDVDLSNKKLEFAKKFFPTVEEEDAIDKFDNVISKLIEKYESQKQSRLAKKVNNLDPLFVLKQLVRGKKWEGAKQSLFKNTLGSWFYKGGKISDETAEQAFNRLYKNAMGETVYDLERITQVKKLSNVKRGQNTDNIDVYSNNLFIDQYVGRHADGFPSRVKVYRGVNNPTVPIRPGDYVTFDKDYAKSYARGKFGSVVSDVIDSNDLYVYKSEPHGSELIYWPEGHQIKKYEGQIPTFREFWKQVNEL